MHYSVQLGDPTEQLVGLNRADVLLIVGLVDWLAWASAIGLGWPVGVKVTATVEYG